MCPQDRTLTPGPIRTAPAAFPLANEASVRHGDGLRVQRTRGDRKHALTRLPAALLREAAWTFRLLVAGRAGQYAWQEVKNKWLCFDLFEKSRSARPGPA